VEELRPGLWTWTAPHPAWTPDQGGPEGWEQDVRSYALDGGDALVLFDPLVEAAAVQSLARGRPVIVILTNYWHRRATAELGPAFGADVYAPASTVAQFDFPVRPYRLADELPGGVVPQVAAYVNESNLWIRGMSALVTGDTFPGGHEGFRLQPDSWLEQGLTPEARLERLRPLLELPVELLLPTHGDPVVEDAGEVLRRALSRGS
jgi:glyoxylase-like metal-dependent hydrolase (beta-lactamase superfamily II)